MRNKWVGTNRFTVYFKTVGGGSIRSLGSVVWGVQHFNKYWNNFRGGNDFEPITMLDVRTLSKFEVQCDTVGWSSSQQQHIDHVHVWNILVGNALQGDSKFERYHDIQWWSLKRTPIKSEPTKSSGRKKCLLRNPHAYSDPIWLPGSKLHSLHWRWENPTFNMESL